MSWKRIWKRLVISIKGTDNLSLQNHLPPCQFVLGWTLNPYNLPVEYSSLALLSLLIHQSVLHVLLDSSVRHPVLLFPLLHPIVLSPFGDIIIPSNKPIRNKIKLTKRNSLVLNSKFSIFSTIFFILNPSVSFNLLEIHIFTYTSNDFNQIFVFFTKSIFLHFIYHRLMSWSDSEQRLLYT